MQRFRSFNDEALYACGRAGRQQASIVGQPNNYHGPGDQERNDLAEGEGGRNYRGGVRTQQDRLRKERQRLRRAEEQHARQNGWPLASIK